MKRIGITGPTGAGKTTALQALAELDAHIIDADAVYHALLESSATLRAELTARFGPSILDGEGRVNRKALGGVVFGDPAALAELNCASGGSWPGRGFRRTTPGSGWRPSRGTAFSAPTAIISWKTGRTTRRRPFRPVPSNCLSRY